MKFKRLIIIGVVLVGVAAIALLLSGREQTQTNPKPTATKEAPTPPETKEAPVKISKQSPTTVVEQSKPSETDVSPETIVPEAVEGRMEPIGAGEGTEELKALVSEELEVDWDEAEKHPQLEESKLSESQQEQVENAPVPVLLPDRQNLVNAALITTGPEWYAASMSEDDASIYVSGVAKVVRVPGAQHYEPPTLGDHAHSLNRSEGIVEISFKAFGIYYTVSVECFDHENDPRCTQDDYAVQLANELKLAPPENP